MSKDKDFIKTKLDVLNVDDRSESADAPRSLRGRYPALSARFAESRDRSDAACARKKSARSRAMIPAVISAAAICSIAVAVAVPLALVDSDGALDGSSGGATNRPYRHEITLDHLTENFDVLIPADTDGIVCYEYKYRGSGAVAYVEYTLDAFTVDVTVDENYRYDDTEFVGLTADGATEFFTYKYKIEQGFCYAMFDRSDNKYYVYSIAAQADAQGLFDLLSSLRPAGES